MSHSHAHPDDPVAWKEFLTQENRRYFTFMNLAFLMTALTGIELVLIFLPFPGSIVLYSSLIFLSLIKFIGVIFWFMHLIYDNRFLTVVFLVGMLLATGTITALLLLFSEKYVDPDLPIFEQVSAFSERVEHG